MDSVIITGSGTGIGRETAFCLARAGYEVYATVLTPDQAGEIEAEASRRGLGNLKAPLLDIRDREAVGSVVRQVHEETGGPFALVNNAGITLRGFFEDLEEEEIRNLFETNVFGTLNVTRAVIPYMREARRGRILIVTSIGGRIGSMGVNAYCSTKFAQEGFGESLYLELLPFGVHVVLIEPPIVKTERWSRNRRYGERVFDHGSPYSAWLEQAEALAQRMVESSPVTPVDVAQTILQALRARRPRLRYLLGRRARLVHAIRRYAPESLFDRFYFGEVIRLVTGKRPS